MHYTCQNSFLGFTGVDPRSLHVYFRWICNSTSLNFLKSQNKLNLVFTFAYSWVVLILINEIATSLRYTVNVMLERDYEKNR